MIQVTHRLTLSPTAALELLNGLNTTLAALRQAQAHRVAQWNLNQKPYDGVVSKRLGSRYVSGRCRDWLKFKNPDALAVKREAEEDWRKGRWS